MRRLCIYLRLKAFQAEGIAEAKVQKCNCTWLIIKDLLNSQRITGEWEAQMQPEAGNSGERGKEEFWRRVREDRNQQPQPTGDQQT